MDHKPSLNDPMTEEEDKNSDFKEVRDVYSSIDQVHIQSDRRKTD